jgi:hypothetical protein
MTAAHATHRPSLPGASGQAQRPTSFGVLYPENDVIAVVDDPAAAARTAAALREAGIPAGDVDVIEGAQFLAMNRYAERRRGPLGRLVAAVSRLFSDDAADEQLFAEAAQQGHALLVVHAPSATTLARVRNVLAQSPAHDARYYGRATVEEIC